MDVSVEIWVAGTELGGVGGEGGPLRAFLRSWREIVQEAAQWFRPGHEGVLVPVLRRPWVSPRPHNHEGSLSYVGAEEFSGLGKLAFASLWLLVFPIPSENPTTTSD